MDNHYKYIESKLSEDDNYFNPSDKVWVGIEENLWPKKSTFLFWWIFGSISLIVGGYFLLHPYAHLDSSLIDENAIIQNVSKDRDQEDLFQSDSEKKDIVQDLSVKSKVETGNYKQTVDRKLVLLNEKSTKTEKIYLSAIANKKLLTPAQNQLAKATDNYRESQSRQDNFKSHSFNNLEIESFVRSTEVNSQPPDQLKIDKLFTEDYSKNVLITGQPAVIPVDSETEWALSVGGWIVVPIERTKVYSNNPLTETTVNSDYNNIHGTSIYVNYLSSAKLAISMGLGYARTSSNTSYALSIAYDLRNEIHDPASASYYNTFVHSLPSAAGRINSILTLNRSDQSDVANNEAINLDLVTETNEQILHLPLGASYFLDNTGKGIFVKAHLDALLTYNKSVRSIDLIQHHDVVSVKEGILKAANNYHLGFTAGLSVGYKVPLSVNGLSLDLITGIQQGLSYEVPFRSWQTSIQISKRM